MRRNADDDEDPFDDGFGGIDQLLNQMTGGGAEHVDVHEYDDHITVVADVPGTEKDDIDLQCDGRSLAIRASTEPRPFVVRVDLPAYVDDQSAEKRYNNGVLEVTLDRTRDPANIGFR